MREVKTTLIRKNMKVLSYVLGLGIFILFVSEFGFLAFEYGFASEGLVSEIFDVRIEVPSRNCSYYIVPKDIDNVHLFNIASNKSSLGVTPINESFFFEQIAPPFLYLVAKNKINGGIVTYEFSITGDSAEFVPVSKEGLTPLYYLIYHLLKSLIITIISSIFFYYASFWVFKSKKISQIATGFCIGSFVIFFSALFVPMLF